MKIYLFWRKISLLLFFDRACVFLWEWAVSVSLRRDVGGDR